jgi:hypothetical protein
MRPAWVRVDRCGGWWPAWPPCQRRAVGHGVTSASMQGLRRLMETILSLAQTRMVKEWGLWRRTA